MCCAEYAASAIDASVAVLPLASLRVGLADGARFGVRDGPGDDRDGVALCF